MLCKGATKCKGHPALEQRCLILNVNKVVHRIVTETVAAAATRGITNGTRNVSDTQ